MRKTTKYAAFLWAAAICCGCAKTVAEGVYDNEVKYLTAWLKYADLSELGINDKAAGEARELPDTLGRGVYLLSEKKSETEGAVNAVRGGYAVISYTTRTLDLDISTYSEESTARQLGEYSKPDYYGPHTISLVSGQNYAGLIDAVAGMSAGDTRTVLIPKWLFSYQDYGTEAEYLSSSSSYSNTIYELTLIDFTTDVKKRQIEQIEEYLRENVIGKMRDGDGKLIEKVDSLEYGFYFIPVTDTAGHKTFASDTTVYINYTGRRLDGQAFDTTVEKTAKDEDIYSNSTAYSAKSVSWGEDYSSLTMSSSSLISGFSKTLWAMNPMGRAIGIFISDFGYASSGSGSKIPGYAPLIFEIELTEEPED